MKFAYKVGGWVQKWSKTEVQEFKDEKTQVDFWFDGIFFISGVDEIETNGKHESFENDNKAKPFENKYECCKMFVAYQLGFRHC